MNDIRYELRLPTEIELEKLTLLYGKTFGENAAKAWRRRWKWQYQSPSLPTEINYCIAKHGDDVVGQYCLIPTPLWWAGREVKSAAGADVFLVPAARGMGAGRDLFVAAYHQSLDVCVGVGLTDASHRLFQRLQWSELGMVPSLRKVFRPGAVIENRLRRGHGLLGRLGVAKELPCMLWSKAHRWANADSEVNVQRASSAGPEYDDLWVQCRSSYPMCARRDARWVQWRYLDAPERPYTLWEARRDGVLVGFAASRTIDINGLRCGLIEDLFAHATDRRVRRSMLAAVLEEFERDRIDLARTISLNREVLSSLREAGFVCNPRGPRLLVQCRLEDKSPLSDTGAWYMTYGDSDLGMGSL